MSVRINLDRYRLYLEDGLNNMRFILKDTINMEEIANADILEELCDNLEYGDVKEGCYLVEDTYSGTRFRLGVDRDVKPKYYYATPYKGTRVVWKPILLEQKVTSYPLPPKFLDGGKNV